MLNKRKKMLIGMTTVIFSTLSVAATAQTMHPSDQDYWSLRLGSASGYKRAEIAWESPAIWSWQTQSSKHRFEISGEIGVAYWAAESGYRPHSAWQLSAIPMARWVYDNTYFVELGAGPTVFNRRHFADKDISTTFQFGDHIGVGAYVGRNSKISLRYSHFSNAGISHPNPGLNILQLNVSHHF